MATSGEVKQPSMAERWARLEQMIAQGQRLSTAQVLRVMRGERE